jgi:hypothetical protein
MTTKKTAKESSLDYSMRGVKPKIWTDLSKFKRTVDLNSLQLKSWGASATFDWTFFDNSNRRKVVRQPSKVVIFDLDLVRRGNSNCRRLN